MNQPTKENNMSFYIKKVTMSGKDVLSSSIDFEPGLNIILGPSNSGKTLVIDCIDFALGKDTNKFKVENGYSTIELHVVTDKGDLFFTRYIGSQYVDVAGNHTAFSSGKYKREDFTKHLLKLIGINENTEIIKNKDYKKISLSFRTFLHSFIIDENTISSATSILLHGKDASKTSNKTALLYLMTGNNFDENSELENQKIAAEKKGAVIKFINENLATIAKKRSKLDRYKGISIDSIKEKIDFLTTELPKFEKEITEKIETNNLLSKSIIGIKDKVTRNNVFLRSFADLKSQYEADIERMDFIIDGKHKHNNIMYNRACPICNQEINLVDNHQINTEIDDRNKITKELNNLKDIIEDTIKENETLQVKMNSLCNQKNQINLILNKHLNPKALSLKSNLKSYRQMIEHNKELEILDEMEKDFIMALEEMKKKETRNAFHPNEYFNNIMNDFCDMLATTLSECNFGKHDSVKFDISDFDFIINGMKKKAEGQGYRSFINIAVSLSLLQYLNRYGKYSPGILIIDSPIVTLTEKSEIPYLEFGRQSYGSMVISENRFEYDDYSPMKNGLFNFLIKNQDLGQIIIAENKIPNIDYSSSKIIEFTKDEKNGRYGYLHSIKD